MINFKQSDITGADSNSKELNNFGCLFLSYLYCDKKNYTKEQAIEFWKECKVLNIINKELMLNRALLFKKLNLSNNQVICKGIFKYAPMQHWWLEDISGNELYNSIIRKDKPVNIIRYNLDGSLFNAEEKFEHYKGVKRISR